MMILKSRIAYLGFVLAVAIVGNSPMLSCQQMLGQVTAGYGPQPILGVAPGQILSITVPVGALQVESIVRSDRTPLPNYLAGFSVSLKQSVDSREIAVPLLAVEFFFPFCPDFPRSQPRRDFPCGSLARLDVQIPFELVPDFPDSSAPIPYNQALLVVRRFGAPYPAIGVQPRTDAIHVATDCDTITRRNDPFCRPLVFHPDGSRVTEYAPAREGETLLIYAYGMGHTEPKVLTGDASQVDEARTVVEFVAEFHFAPFETMPQWLGTSESSQLVKPDYAGLVKGFAGLYQLNLKVPAVPALLKPCGLIYRPNAIVNLFGRYSRDSVALCVSSD